VQPVATEGAPAESPPLRPRIQPMQALDPIPETGALKAPKLNSLTGAPARTGRRAAPAGSCAILWFADASRILPPGLGLVAYSFPIRPNRSSGRRRFHP